MFLEAHYSPYLLQHLFIWENFPRLLLRLRLRLLLLLLLLLLMPLCTDERWTAIPFGKIDSSALIELLKLNAKWASR